MGDEQSKIEYGDEDKLTIKQIGEVLHLNRERVRQLILEYEIPYEKIGRSYIIRFKDLAPLYDRETTPGPKPRPFKSVIGRFDE